MEIRLTLEEAKRRLKSYEEFYSKLNIKEEGFYQVSQYGFSDENNNVIYPDSRSIATHLILSRYVMNVNNISRAIHVERIKNDLNIFYTLETYHIRNIKDLIIDGIINLSEAGIITLYFIKDEGREFHGTTKELKARLKDKTDPFKFTQTLKEVNGGSAMYFRMYNEHFETLVSEAFAEDAREVVGNENKGISIKFDALAVYGSIASRLNAINKETMFALEEFENYDNSDIFKSDYKFYGNSINYSSQQALSRRTSSDKSKSNSGIGVDRMNKLELLMTKKYNMFVHVKVARINRPQYNWNIYRAFACDRKALYKFVYMEIQKSFMELKEGKLSENAVVNILEYKYLYTKKIDLDKDLELSNSLNENIKETSVDTEDEVEEKVDHKDGFDLEDEYKEIMSKIQSYGIEFSKVKQLHKLNEISEEIFGEGNKMTDATEDEIALLRIALNKIEELEIKPFEPLKDEINEDEKRSSLAEEDKENRYANDIQSNYTTNNKKSTQKKLNPFSRYAAEQKVVRIYDQHPYDEKESDFDKLINEVRSLIK